MIAWACWSISARAADHDPEAGIDCKTAYATPAVEECARRAYQVADLRLNEAYRAATVSIDVDPADVPSNVRAKWHVALSDAQRDWIAFRDAECALTGFDWYGGSGRAGAEIDCMTKLTERRIEELLLHVHPR